jgi:uncharacterized protein
MLNVGRRKSMDITVKNNASAKRFEAEVAGFLAFIEYNLAAGSLTLVHTEVPSALEGQGVGSIVVNAALNYAKEQGLKVVPQCPFVGSYIKRHQEYENLVSQTVSSVD